MSCRSLYGIVVTSAINNRTAYTLTYQPVPTASLNVSPLHVLIKPNSSFFEHHEEAKVRLETYKPDRNRVVEDLGQRLHRGSDPKEVARIVVKAARAWYPATRYTAGQGSGLLKVARTLVPTSLFDKSVRLALGTR